MEATEIAETIAEPHGHAHEAAHHHITDETFRKRVGVYIAVLAMGLAITGLGGAGAMKQVINANIERSDDYAFYQAKNLRQTTTRIADDQLRLTAGRPDLTPESVQALAQLRTQYAQDIERLESDTTKNDGKKEILAKAKIAEEARDQAQERSENFEWAEAFLQIAVVIASTSILTASRPLLLLSAILAALGTLAAANGFLLFASLPAFG
jgi:Domain of unknown function (DUF4337)